jgi:hypothetical protein
MTTTLLTRRSILVALAAGAMFPVQHATAAASSALDIVVTRDPNCACCALWVDHLRSNGFTAKMVETTDVAPFKRKLGIPPALHSCHTAEIGRYAIEGHVPAAAIKRLLEEAPAARGLAVPGMPIGSPGMEIAGHPPEIYDVILFGLGGQRTFARFRGGEELKS